MVSDSVPTYQKNLAFGADLSSKELIGLTFAKMKPCDWLEMIRMKPAKLIFLHINWFKWQKRIFVVPQLAFLAFLLLLGGMTTNLVLPNKLLVSYYTGLTLQYQAKISFEVFSVVCFDECKYITWLH